MKRHLRAAYITSKTILTYRWIQRDHKRQTARSILDSKSLCSGFAECIRDLVETEMSRSAGNVKTFIGTYFPSCRQGSAKSRAGVNIRHHMHFFQLWTCLKCKQSWPLRPFFIGKRKHFCWNKCSPHTLHVRVSYCLVWPLAPRLE